MDYTPMSEEQINWNVLRRCLQDDVARFREYGEASQRDGYPLTAAMYFGRVDGLRMALDSMGTIESTHAGPVPGLAEHTAAACDKIIEASKTPLIHWARLDDDDTFSVACGATDATEVYLSANTEPDLVTCPTCAAACDTITKAATA